MSIAALVGGFVIVASIGLFFIILIILAIKDAWDMWRSKKRSK